MLDTSVGSISSSGFFIVASCSHSWTEIFRASPVLSGNTANMGRENANKRREKREVRKEKKEVKATKEELKRMNAEERARMAAEEEDLGTYMRD